MPPQAPTLVIGSRGSELALWQTRHIGNLIYQLFPEYILNIKIIRTLGDQIIDRPLVNLGGKGVFTKEIEQALLAGQIDLAVHSLKDLPTESPPGLTIAAIPSRADVADVLITKGPTCWDQLPRCATVLTGSLRRRAQTLHFRPDLRIESIRGNVPTRLEKFRESSAAALIMAAAGLDRLDLDTAGLTITRLDPHEFLPACGQGALAVQARTGDSRLHTIMAALDDKAARCTTAAERSVLATLEGGCQVPLGAYAYLEENTLSLWAMVADLEGRRHIVDHIEGTMQKAEDLGRDLAQRLLDRGGKAILNDIRQAENS